jgi:hypothetical protein
MDFVSFIPVHGDIESEEVQDVEMTMKSQYGETSACYCSR